MLLSILFALCLLSSFSQENQSGFSSIDWKVRFMGVTSPDSLAKQLIVLGKTDREKVRAIFRWITEHIDYNTKIFNRDRQMTEPCIIYGEPEDSSSVLKSLNERVAVKVLHRKIAFCDGYTRLFKTLCDYGGIPCEIITGYARTGQERTGNRFGVNHTWNAVYLDNAWHLLDVTWASGFISYSNEFTRYYDDFYFLTPPQQFIRDHYPEDLQWTLLPDPPTFREFNNSPFRYSAFIKSGIISYLPAKGIIEAAVGDTIRVELKIKTAAKNLFVVDAPLTDSSVMFLQPVAAAACENVSYIYTIAADTKDWLYVYYNDEIVMRYKLNLKKEKEAEADRLNRLSLNR